MLGKISQMLAKKCHFCKKPILGKVVTAEVKVPTLVGLHKRHFCSEEHYSKYQNYITEYEKKRKIPMKNSFVCTSCLRK